MGFEVYKISPLFYFITVIAEFDASSLAKNFFSGTRFPNFSGGPVFIIRKNLLFKSVIK